MPAFNNSHDMTHNKITNEISCANLVRTTKTITLKAEKDYQTLIFDF